MADLEAGVELMALAYRWGPSEADAMTVEEFVRWARRAGEVLKERAGT